MLTRTNRNRLKNTMADYHKHHIVYKSRGGSDNPSNLVVLSPYDHALLHAQDFLKGGADFDFRHEAWPLLPQDLREKVKVEKSNRLKSKHPMNHPGAREKVSLKLSGQNNPMYGLFGEDNPNFGSRRTPEQCENISRSKRGKPNPKRSENLKLNPIQLSPEGRKKSNNNLEEYRQSGQHALEMAGRSWWVNELGETKFQQEPPGEGWKQGRKWRN